MKELLLRQSSAPLQQSSHTPPPDLCALPVDFSYNPPPPPQDIFFLDPQVFHHLF